LIQAFYRRELIKPEVLEIGCYSGYSALAWYEATKKTNAEIITLELDPKMIAASKRTIEKYKLGDRVHLIEGYAQDSIETLSGQFDIIFVDANKDGYETYVKQILNKKLLSPHGLIMCDNGKQMSQNSPLCSMLTTILHSLRPRHDHLNRGPAEQKPRVLDRMWQSPPALLYLLQERPPHRHHPHARVRRRHLHQVEAVSGLIPVPVSGASLTFGNTAYMISRLAEATKPINNGFLPLPLL
jgi:16S rRNA G966 N2-methylase RsmD